MLFFYEIKKLIKNRAALALMLLLLAATLAAAVKSAASAKERTVEAEEAAEEFAAFVSDTERAANTALRAAKEGYAVSYYSEVIERYSAARESVAFKSGDVSGWDELLSFDVPLFAGLLVSVFLGSVSFYEDRRKGTSQIITASKNGRRVLAGFRVLSAVFLSLVFCLLSALLSFLCFLVMGLAKNGGFPLQSAASFFNSADDLSLLQAFLLITLRRCLILAAVTAGACLVSKLLSGYIPILLVSAAFPAVEFALFSIRYHAVDVLVKNVNVFSYGTGYLFRRFYCVRLFGIAHPEAVMLVASTAAIVILASLAVFLPESGKAGGLDRIKLPFSIRLPKIKAHPHGLFAWESVKLLRAPAILLPVLICLVFGITGIMKNGPVKASQSEELYRAYCEEFAGRSIEEVNDMISEEEMRIQMGLSRMDEADRLFESGEMGFEEYTEISREYIDCLIREGQINALKARADYLLDASAELGSDMEFVYDTGLNKLLSRETNFLFVLAVLLIACSPFYKEKESGAFQVIRSYKNGRRRLYLTRLLFTAVCALAVTALFSAAELYAHSGDGIFDALSAPAASLEKLRDFGTASIGSVHIQINLIRFLAALCAALITFALSTRFESIFPVLAPAAGWALISFALRRLGMSFPPADLSAFLSGSSALISSGPSAWLFMLPLAAITALLLVWSYKRYSCSGRRQ
jgi:hypothetical protein